MMDVGTRRRRLRNTAALGLILPLSLAAASPAEVWLPSDKVHIDWGDLEDANVSGWVMASVNLAGDLAGGAASAAGRAGRAAGAAGRLSRMDRWEKVSSRLNKLDEGLDRISYAGAAIQNSDAVADHSEAARQRLNEDQLREHLLTSGVSEGDLAAVEAELAEAGGSLSDLQDGGGLGRQLQDGGLGAVAGAANLLGHLRVGDSTPPKFKDAPEGFLTRMTGASWPSFCLAGYRYAQQLPGLPDPLGPPPGPAGDTIFEASLQAWKDAHLADLEAWVARMRDLDGKAALLESDLKNLIENDPSRGADGDWSTTLVENVGVLNFIHTTISSAETGDVPAVRAAKAQFARAFLPLVPRDLIDEVKRQLEDRLTALANASKRRRAEGRKLWDFDSLVQTAREARTRSEELRAKLETQLTELVSGERPARDFAETWAKYQEYRTQRVRYVKAMGRAEDFLKRTRKFTTDGVYTSTHARYDHKAWTSRLHSGIANWPDTWGQPAYGVPRLVSYRGEEMDVGDAVRRHVQLAWSDARALLDGFLEAHRESYRAALAVRGRAALAPALPDDATREFTALARPLQDPLREVHELATGLQEALAATPGEGPGSSEFFAEALAWYPQVDRDSGELLATWKGWADDFLTRVEASVAPVRTSALEARVAAAAAKVEEWKLARTRSSAEKTDAYGDRTKLVTRVYPAPLASTAGVEELVSQLKRLQEDLGAPARELSELSQELAAQPPFSEAQRARCTLGLSPAEELAAELSPKADALRVIATTALGELRSRAQAKAIQEKLRAVFDPQTIRDLEARVKRVTGTASHALSEADLGSACRDPARLLAGVALRDELGDLLQATVPEALTAGTEVGADRRFDLEADPAISFQRRRVRGWHSRVTQAVSCAYDGEALALALALDDSLVRRISALEESARTALAKGEALDLGHAMGELGELRVELADREGGLARLLEDSQRVKAHQQQAGEAASPPPWLESVQAAQRDLPNLRARLDEVAKALGAGSALGEALRLRAAAIDRWLWKTHGRELAASLASLLAEGEPPQMPPAIVAAVLQRISWARKAYEPAPGVRAARQLGAALGRSLSPTAEPRLVRPPFQEATDFSSWARRIEALLKGWTYGGGEDFDALVDLAAWVDAFSWTDLDAAHEAAIQVAREGTRAPEDGPPASSPRAGATLVEAARKVHADRRLEATSKLSELRSRLEGLAKSSTLDPSTRVWLGESQARLEGIVQLLGFRLEELGDHRVALEAAERVAGARDSLRQAHELSVRDVTAWLDTGRWEAEEAAGKKARLDAADAADRVAAKGLAAAAVAVSARPGTGQGTKSLRTARRLLERTGSWRNQLAVERRRVRARLELAAPARRASMDRALSSLLEACANQLFALEMSRARLVGTEIPKASRLQPMRDRDGALAALGEVGRARRDEAAGCEREAKGVIDHLAKLTGISDAIRETLEADAGGLAEKARKVRASFESLLADLKDLRIQAWSRSYQHWVRELENKVIAPRRDVAARLAEGRSTIEEIDRAASGSKDLERLQAVRARLLGWLEDLAGIESERGALAASSEDWRDPVTGKAARDALADQEAKISKLAAEIRRVDRDWSALEAELTGTLRRGEEDRLRSRLAAARPRIGEIIAATDSLEARWIVAGTAARNAGQPREDGLVSSGSQGWQDTQRAWAELREIAREAGDQLAFAHSEGQGLGDLAAGAERFGLVSPIATVAVLRGQLDRARVRLTTVLAQASRAGKALRDGFYPDSSADFQMAGELLNDLERTWETLASRLSEDQLAALVEGSRSEVEWPKRRHLLARWRGDLVRARAALAALEERLPSFPWARRSTWADLDRRLAVLEARAGEVETRMVALEGRRAELLEARAKAAQGAEAAWARFEAARAEAQARFATLRREAEARIHWMNDEAQPALVEARQEAAPLLRYARLQSLEARLEGASAKMKELADEVAPRLEALAELLDTARRAGGTPRDAPTRHQAIRKEGQATIQAVSQPGSSMLSMGTRIRQELEATRRATLALLDPGIRKLRIQRDQDREALSSWTKEAGGLALRIEASPNGVGGADLEWMRRGLSKSREWNARAKARRDALETMDEALAAGLVLPQGWGTSSSYRHMIVRQRGQSEAFEADLNAAVQAWTRLEASLTSLLNTALDAKIVALERRANELAPQAEEARQRLRDLAATPAGEASSPLEAERLAGMHEDFLEDVKALSQAAQRLRLDAGTLEVRARSAGAAAVQRRAGAVQRQVEGWAIDTLMRELPRFVRTAVAARGQDASQTLLAAEDQLDSLEARWEELAPRFTDRVVRLSRRQGGFIWTTLQDTLAKWRSGLKGAGEGLALLKDRLGAEPGLRTRSAKLENRLLELSEKADEAAARLRGEAKPGGPREDPWVRGIASRIGQLAPEAQRLAKVLAEGRRATSEGEEPVQLDPEFPLFQAHLREVGGVLRNLQARPDTGLLPRFQAEIQAPLRRAVADLALALAADAAHTEVFRRLGQERREDAWNALVATIRQEFSSLLDGVEDPYSPQEQSGLGRTGVLKARVRFDDQDRQTRAKESLSDFFGGFADRNIYRMTRALADDVQPPFAVIRQGALEDLQREQDIAIELTILSWLRSGVGLCAQTRWRRTSVRDGLAQVSNAALRVCFDRSMAIHLFQGTLPVGLFDPEVRRLAAGGQPNPDPTDTDIPEIPDPSPPAPTAPPAPGEPPPDVPQGPFFLNLALDPNPIHGRTVAFLDVETRSLRFDADDIAILNSGAPGEDVILGVTPMGPGNPIQVRAVGGARVINCGGGRLLSDIVNVNPPLGSTLENDVPGPLFGVLSGEGNFAVLRVPDLIQATMLLDDDAVFNPVGTQNCP